MTRLRHSFRILHSAFCIALAAASAGAREITSLSIDADAGTATIAFTAGSAGDGHVLYYAWSNDGADKGANLASWPHVVRLCRVADGDTGCTFALPAEAAPIGRYSARAFLATTTKNYDNYVTWIRATGAQYIDTGVLPNKTVAVAMDFKMTSAKGQQYVFGATTSSSGTTVSGLLTFCAYINGSANSGGKWSFTCKDDQPTYTAGLTTVSTSYRTQICLDAASKKYIVAQNGTVTTNTTPTTTIATGLANVSICLFTRNQASSASSISVAGGDMLAKLYCYSCSVTNGGNCVRNYLPAVKDGVAGLYDTVNNTFNPSASATAFVSSGVTNLTFAIEGGDTVAAASAAFISESSDFTTDTPYVEANSLTFTTGGSKSGVAPLVLTGANNWGGTFTVNEGALIADFGQGLATTDNLVFNGGTYGLHAGSTFNWTIGNGGGETSLGAGAATSLGFTAYGNPFSVVAGGNAATPVEFGTASSTGFNPAQFVLNDDWATDTVTFKNGIAGANGDSSKPNLKIYTGAADAVLEGNVSGVNLYKLGAGRLALRGANNSLGALYPQGGRLVIAPPEGVATTTLSLSGGFSTAQGTEVVISNAVITHGGPMNCNNKTKQVSLVGCSSTANSDQNWTVGNDDTWGNSTLVLDASTVRTDGYAYFGKAQTTPGTIVMTNNSSLVVSLLHARKGTMNQHGGTVQIKADNNNAGWLGQSGTFTYHLRGGTLLQANGGGSAHFNLGSGSSTGSGTTYKGTGILHVYAGATFMANGAGVFLAKSDSSDNGQLYVNGGTATMTREGAALHIGYKGTGTAEVSNGGVLDVQKGDIVAVTKSQNVAGRTGTLRVTDGGMVKARGIYSDSTGSTANLVLDGGRVVANAGSTTNDLIYGFTAAVVGVNGATVDTNGQDKKISQSFAARTGAGQTAPTAESGAELTALPAFTKVGAGRLELTGANDWLCATCVSNGTLAVASGALPATTLRLGGGVIDLCGATHTVENLVGSGVVSNGTLIVTGAVWPGVGDSGVLKIDASASVSLSSIGCAVNGDGTCGYLVVDGTLNLADVTVVGENLENRREGKSLVVAKATAIAGRPATHKVGRLGVFVGGDRLVIGASGTVLIVR